MNTAKQKKVLVILVLLMAFIIRLVKIDTLPSALFGDVIQHLYKAKEHNLSWFGGDGPFFTLITILTTKIFGYSFWTLKITTILISVLTIFFTYLYALKLTKKFSLAIFASVFSTLSFWSISFSHQGKPYILVPLFAVLISYLLLQKKHLIAGLVLGLSTYTQASAWGLLPLAFVSPLTFLGTLISGSLFFKNMFFTSNSLMAPQSYLGEKMNLFSLGISALPTLISKVFLNLFKQISALFINGDRGFRSNIPLQPHIDTITAIFFVLGIMFTLVYFILISQKVSVKKSIKKYFYPIFITFIVPFFLVQLSAALDVNNPQSTPNHGRTLGMTPYVFIAASYGLYCFYDFFKKNILLPISVFILVAGLNLYNYWVVYPKTLPNDNVPFAEIIAFQAALIDPKTPVYIYNTGWGDYGQPESNAFDFLPNNGFSLYPFIHKETLCDSLNISTPEAIFFTKPGGADFTDDFEEQKCGRWRIKSASIIENSGQEVSSKIVLTNSLN